MGQGTVTVNNLNMGQGSFPEIERKALFIGLGTENVGAVLSVNTQTDVEASVGEDTDGKSLAAQLLAAQANGGENWEAFAAPVGAGDGWQVALDAAMQTVSPELVVICIPAVTKAEVEALYTEAESIRTSLGRRVIILTATAGIDVALETWAAYEASQAALTDGVSGYRVACVPLLHGNDLGVLAGRLCNRAVSIADSPMRVATGPVLGLGDTPVDSEGVELPSATLTNLDTNRLSCIQRYTDYPGTFWGDCNLLDEPAGDYQVIENLRVIDKAARAVRILAIRRVANRSLNDSAISISANKTYFMRPLREMSKSTVFAGEHFPGDIRPPADDSIRILWPDNDSVEIYIKARPYNSPKDITANLILDLSSGQ